MDSRIGSRFLHAGWVMADLAFRKMCRLSLGAQQQGVDFQLLQEIRRVQRHPEGDLFNKVRAVVVDTARKRLPPWALAFKGRYGRHSDSPALTVIKKLAGTGTLITAYDPQPWSAPERCSAQ